MQSAETVARQLAGGSNLFAELGVRLRRLQPTLVVTCARGSSDHASVYGKYLIETVLGCPVASVGPSISSVYRRQLRLSGALFVVVSQSGQSPDLLQLTRSAREAGAFVVGFANDMSSPLPELCDACIPLSAGPERSVAATKSCIASMAALLQLVAYWRDDPELHRELTLLPAHLGAAQDCDWYPTLAELAGASSLYVVGRGIGLGTASEMALKFKETCRLHAEAFSAAEVVHGPMALIGPGFPVIALSQSDATSVHTAQVVRRMMAAGARVWMAGERVDGAVTLPVPLGISSLALPLAVLPSFYLALARLARDRGIDPDTPPHLNKVTETL